MNFWVKTKSELPEGWAAWSPVLEGRVFMVASGWLGRRWEGEGRWRSAREEMRREKSFRE
jgi:hypothetical protein